jgi:hypothetical protein
MKWRPKPWGTPTVTRVQCRESIMSQGHRLFPAALSVIITPGPAERARWLTRATRRSESHSCFSLNKLSVTVTVTQCHGVTQCGLGLNVNLGNSDLPGRQGLILLCQGHFTEVKKGHRDHHWAGCHGDRPRWFLCSDQNRLSFCVITRISNSDSDSD